MGGGRYFQFLSLSCNRIPVVKGNLHIFSFSWLKIRLFIILQIFLHFWNGIVKGLFKIFHFLNTFFRKHFITGFCDEKFNFCKFANFFSDSKSRAQELSIDVSFVIFGHQTLGGGQIDPPLPSISWFSSTPAGIGLRFTCYKLNLIYVCAINS